MQHSTHSCIGREGGKKCMPTLRLMIPNSAPQPALILLRLMSDRSRMESPVSSPLFSFPIKNCNTSISYCSQFSPPLPLPLPSPPLCLHSPYTSPPLCFPSPYTFPPLPYTFPLPPSPYVSQGSPPTTNTSVIEPASCISTVDNRFTTSKYSLSLNIWVT